MRDPTPRPDRPDPPADDEAAERAALLAHLTRTNPDLVRQLRPGALDRLPLDQLRDLVRVESDPGRRAAIARASQLWLGLHPARRS